MIDKHAEYANNVIQLASMNLALLADCFNSYKSAIECADLPGYDTVESVKKQYELIVDKIEKEIKIEEEKITAANQLKSAALRCKATEKLNSTLMKSGARNEIETTQEMQLLKQKRYELEALTEIRSNNG